MDLSEYYLSYYQDIEAQLEILQKCLQGLKHAPNDLSLVDAAARTVHSIKGASWTIRDTPTLLNNEPADIRYDGVAALAEHLETHLEAVSSGESSLDQAILNDGLASLVSAILALRSQH